MSKLPLNRKETTLRTFDPELCKGLAICAGNRARQIEDRNDTDRIGREYDSAGLWWDRCRVESLGPFPANFGEGIIVGSVQNPRYDSLLLSLSHHLENSLGSDTVDLPQYVADAINEGQPETVCNYLQAVDDTNSPYTWHVLDLSGDLDSNETVTVYVKLDASDYLLSPFYASHGGYSLWNCTDTTVANCDLLETTLGWYVTTLDGERVDDFDCLSAGYSRSPTSQLERLLPTTKGLPSELVTWHHGFQCFIARLKGHYAPVLLHPEAPSYSC